MQNSLKDILKVVVENPALETLEKDENAVDKLIWIHILWIDAVPEVSGKKLTEPELIWVTALPKELMWAIISVLSCSYLSSLVIMRAIFEMLIKSLTLRGSTRGRISEITFLDEDEKKEFKVLWEELSAIAHPYAKWFKVFPPETWTYFHYNQTACKVCVDYLLTVSDLMMVVALEKGFCDPEKVSAGIKALELKFSQKRLNKK